MAAKKGNQNAKGNKGGGRKSAYEEEKCAQALKDAFTKGFDLEKAKEIIAMLKDKKGKLNFTELALFRAVGNDKVLMELLKKVVPDKIKHEGELSSEPIKIEIVQPAQIKPDDSFKVVEAMPDDSF